MHRRVRHIPEQAVNCLVCACDNPDNAAASALLRESESRTSTGVIAAIYVARNHDHCEIVRLARRAISEQRTWCVDHGPFRPDQCTRRRFVTSGQASPDPNDSMGDDDCVCALEA